MLVFELERRTLKLLKGLVLLRDRRVLSDADVLLAAEEEFPQLVDPNRELLYSTGARCSLVPGEQPTELLDSAAQLDR